MEKLIIEELDREKCCLVFKEFGEFAIRSAKVVNQTDFCSKMGWGAAVYSQIKGNDSSRTLKDIRRKTGEALAYFGYEVWVNKQGDNVFMEHDSSLSNLISHWEKRYRKYVHHYLYHYVANLPPKGSKKPASNSSVRRAYLVINYSTNEACLAFIISSDDRAKMLEVEKAKKWSIENIRRDLNAKLDDWVVTRYFGKVEKVENQLYLNFHHRYRYNKKEGCMQTLPHRGLNVFQVSKGSRLQGTVFGNFSSMGLASGMCAVVE